MLSTPAPKSKKQQQHGISPAAYFDCDSTQDDSCSTCDGDEEGEYNYDDQRALKRLMLDEAELYEDTSRDADYVYEQSNHSFVSAVSSSEEEEEDNEEEFTNLSLPELRCTRAPNSQLELCTMQYLAEQLNVGAIEIGALRVFESVFDRFGWSLPDRREPPLVATLRLPNNGKYTLVGNAGRSNGEFFLSRMFPQDKPLPHEARDMLALFVSVLDCAQMVCEHRMSMLVTEGDVVHAFCTHGIEVVSIASRMDTYLALRASLRQVPNDVCRKIFGMVYGEESRERGEVAIEI